jgi:hypothetical protein
LKRLRWLSVLPIACLLLAGCDQHPAKKPDPTKGVVTGIVFCADTGKPARFATVTLSQAPRKDTKLDQGNPLPSSETTTTGLDGRFRMEAVEPGRYYAIATQEGYLDPWRGLDLPRIRSMASDREQALEAVREWKDYLVEVTVAVHKTVDLSLTMERAAEIGGTVTFDDGSPAIGMHFQLLRKTDKGFSEVGLNMFGGWSLAEVSNGHGHFSLTNLPAGEYTVCALMPGENQLSTLRVCLGDTFRKRDAATVKVQAGEAAKGADIEIPLNGLHTVSGAVTAVNDGHAVAQGTVALLYADDREKARETSLEEDGSFAFEYVPEGKYILTVSDAQDKDPKAEGPEAGGAAPKPVLHYTGKEIPLNVLGEVNEVQIALPTVPPDNSPTN